MPSKTDERAIGSSTSSKTFTLIPYGCSDITPTRVRVQHQRNSKRLHERTNARVVTDYAASMTEQQAFKMHQRLTGVGLVHAAPSRPQIGSACAKRKEVV